MFTNVNLSAPIGAMAFLGTSFLLLLAAAAFALHNHQKKIWLEPGSASGRRLIGGDLSRNLRTLP